MINSEYNILFDKWTEKNKSRVLDDWIRLAQIPSIKSKPCKDAPFGENCKKALLMSADLFERDGFDSFISKNNSYALCSYGEGEKKIGIFSHSDVVPVGDGWLYTEPFKPVIIDGTLIGRGVEDNKSGIIAALCIFNFLKDNNIKLKNRIELFIGADEECGMNDMKDYLAEQTMPEISLVPDADFPCSVGEKGIYHLMAESMRPFGGITSFEGGEAYNIVLDSLIVRLPYREDDYNELVEKTAEKDCFVLDTDNNEITLQVKGIAKHASIPEGSVNAALIAAELLMSCSFTSENDKVILKGARELLSCYYGRGFGIEHDDPVFGKTTCVNGMCRTVDGKLRLSFDIRYGDTVNPEELEKTGDCHLEEKGFIPVEKENRPGFSIDKSSPYPSVFEDIYAELTGERLERVTMAGGTYARKLKNAFSIGTSVIKKDRETPVFKMPEGHGGAHQCDECIDIEGFFEAVKVMLNYILAIDD